MNIKDLHCPWILIHKYILIHNIHKSILININLNRYLFFKINGGCSTFVFYFFIVLLHNSFFHLFCLSTWWFLLRILARDYVPWHEWEHNLIQVECEELTCQQKKTPSLILPGHDPLELSYFTPTICVEQAYVWNKHQCAIWHPEFEIPSWSRTSLVTQRDSDDCS